MRLILIGTRRLAVFVIGTLALTAVPVTSTHALDEPFSAAQEQRVHQLVREYLLANPEVLVEAFEVLQSREEEVSAARAQATLAERSHELFESPLDPIGGNPGGTITVVEFFDYNCPFCRQVKPTVRELLTSELDVRYVYKEFPILAESSVFAARAALAVWHIEPELYEAFHDALMEGSGRLSDDVVLDRAAGVGVDVDFLRQEMDDPEIAETIQANIRLAQALNISGTPTFIIGEQILAGAQSLQALRDAIQGMRED